MQTATRIQTVTMERIYAIAEELGRGWETDLLSGVLACECCGEAALIRRRKQLEIVLCDNLKWAIQECFRCEHDKEIAREMARPMPRYLGRLVADWPKPPKSLLGARLISYRCGESWSRDVALSWPSGMSDLG
jgi:hypothetical protein